MGDVLSISVPFGALVLDDYSGRPMVFAGAGIGITPMAGMLSHLAAVGSHLPIMLLHAAHDEDAFALRGQIRDDIATLPNASMYVWYEQGANSQLPVQGVFPAGWTSRRFNYPTMRRITCADRFRSCRRYAAP
jgi:nitric oxide dioxygenase